MNSYVSPSYTEEVEVDPAAPGTVFRKAAAYESAMNVVGGLAFLLFPSQCLRLVSEPNSVTTTGAVVLRWVGGLTLAVTSNLVFSYFNTRGSIEARPAAYYNLMAGELTIIPLLLAYGSHTTLTPTFLFQATAGLAVIAAWRAYVIFVKPEWFGRYKLVSKKTN